MPVVPNKDRHVYEMLNGEKLSIGWLEPSEIQYLERIKELADADDDYFTLLRMVRGREARTLTNFGGIVTPEACQSVFFRVASDIAERVGIRQGRSLLSEQLKLDPNASLLSMTETAKLIGKSRQMVHLALIKGKIRGWRVGAAWIVDAGSALRYAELHQ